MALAHFPSPTAAHPGREAWPPGVYFESPPPASTAPPEPLGGVPAFLGFAEVDPALREHGGEAGILLERWDAHLWQRLIVPAAGSTLRAAVRGHFANGGRRCVVIARPFPTGGRTAAETLARVLEAGGALADRTDVDLVCVPDAARVDPAEHAGVLAAALRHCEAMGDRFALLDVPPPAPGARPADAARAAEDWLRLASGLRSPFGALYAPWLVADPTRDAVAPPTPASLAWRHVDVAEAAGVDNTAPPLAPPCGHVAGLIARLDRRVGPQQAPANELLDGVLDTALHLSAAQRGRLNAGGVNGIHPVPGRGVRVGGARTLSGAAAWAHVPTARVVLAFRRWVALRMRDLVFEPQTPALRDVVRTRLVARCLEMQRAGALAGQRPEDAFQVQCDAETNPPEERDLGRVVARVALAVQVPAEFVVLRVVQDASGFTASETS